MGLAGVLLAATVALPMSGCRDREGISNVHAVFLNNPEQRHPIRFAHRTETLFVEIPSGGVGLGAEQRTDVYRFLRQFKSESTQRLVLSAPAGMRDHFAARQVIRDIDVLMQELELGADLVVKTRHRGRLRGNQPVIKLTYRRPVALPPRCGNWPKDVGVDRERVYFENFGCSTQRNIGLTVSNARDLMGPQPESPRSSERRTQQWKEYTGSGSGGASAPAPAGNSAAPTPVR
ncbi:MAG: CpaD family pilus assembly lipoprotein [Hyphomicrobiaceae bacterium]|nr:CpaD family pilus assembly lipoprotein [Hyphomicrobiaceae bacterium]